MESQWKSNLIVGVFVSLVLVIFIYFIMHYTNELGLFDRRAFIKTKFQKPEGLFKGSSVQLNNVKIGRITDIEFSGDLKDPHVYITMIINASDLLRIGADAVANIQTAGLLGDSLINVDPGNPVQSGHINDGDFIESKEKSGLFGGLDVEALGKKINNILDKIDQGGIEAISSTVKNVSDITEQIKKGEGTIGKLIYDEKLINQINASVNNLNNVIGRANSGPGSVHTLLYKDDVGKVLGDLKSISKNLDEVSKKVNTVMNQIEDKEVAKKLSEMADNLEKTSKSIQQVAESIESGQGTIGALINDPSLYQDLKTIMGGAKRSDALKYVIQYTIKQKQKAAEKEKKNTPPPAPEQPPSQPTGPSYPAPAPR